MIDPLILVRWVHFAATALAAGTVLFVVLVAEPAFRSAGVGADWVALHRWSRWFTWAGLAVAVGSGAVWLVWLASDIYGVSLVDACLHGGALSVLAETRFGMVWEARLALALLLGTLMPWPKTRLLQTAAAAGLIGSPAFIGHAGATPGAAGNVHLASDVLHLIAASAWIGALPAFALLLHQTRRTGSGAWAAATARHFSPLGIASVGTLLVTGLINSWNLLSGPRDLIATGYGRLVLLKIGLFAAMIGIAAVNRYRLTPRLPFPAALRSLERNILAEIGLGIVIFLLVGALGTMAPSAHDHVHVPTRPIAADAAFVHIHSTEAMADVMIEPGRVGPAHARIFLMREDFSIFTVKHITFLLTPPVTDAAPISLAAQHLPDGAWRVDGLKIGLAGIWVVKLTIDTGTGEPIVLDAPIMIDRDATSSTSKKTATQSIACFIIFPIEPTSFTAALCSDAGPRRQM